jgi:hypothetical protein
MRSPVHIEAYAIVSEDGMLTDAQGNIPSSLRIGADQHFFESGLDAVDIVVNGRNSQEQLAHSAMRRRVLVTGSIPAVAPVPSNSREVYWNPEGAPFEKALSAFAAPNRSIAVIGGPRVFEFFLDLYDVFYLSRVAHVRLPGGLPIFRGVPSRTPEAVLANHGLDNPRHEVVDTAHGLTITAWQRSEV